MKFLNTLATLAISTIAAAHCMKKGQQISASFISNPSDEMLPGANLVYYCTDEDIDSSISITNLDVFPGIPTA
ncbi:putative secreted effector protein [Blumeria graminis f. sp. tritici 96224]|nr:putative secreted effector protein [Blumeria graminis f. sp. tritici 96224]